MENLDLTLSLLVDKLRQAGFEQAPEVIDGAIRAIYWDGIVQLGAFTVVVIVTITCTALLLAGIFSKTFKEDDKAAAICVGGICALIAGFISLTVGVSSNPWLKVFDSQAALYQQIMKGLLP